MRTTEADIRQVVQEVLQQLGRAPYVSGNGHARDGAWGVFKTVNQAVDAATAAFRTLSQRGIADRAKAIDCIRKITDQQADELGRLELEETKVGRLDHKIEKLHIIKHVPGVEFLRTDCYSGDHGLTLTEYAPFGVIGVITPVTHSLPTVAGNAINMLAAGNTMVINAHPAGARIAAEGVRRFNRAIHQATGLENLICIVEQPTLESAAEVFQHRGVRLLCVTGGPAVGRAALESRKRAIVAGPGNPPVVVDESACLENAAKCIVQGAAFDNNLLCIGEKEVFAVESIFSKLMEAMGRSGAFLLNRQQIEQLSAMAFKPGKDHPVLNREVIGKDATVLAEMIGVRAPAGTQLLFGETDESNPFVSEEQMTPFVPFVRVRDFRQGLELAIKHEHGFRHTAVIHSRNVRNMTIMGREVDTTVYVKNGPSVAGLGVGGEGYLSWSIATPTGEGITSPLTFTRHRRCALIDDLHIL
ncbi:MAG: aldehyde dehydrogenase family protein [Planctomycetaceae bacterium]